LKIENKTECHDITLDLKDAYLENGHILLDPIVTRNGLMKILKKTRIIRSVCGLMNYGYVPVPVAKVNMGILKQYDLNGVTKHLETISKGVNHE
jgi:hypothetical protein